MSAAKVNIYIEQGATFRMAARLKDEFGVPFDLTGFIFTGQIRKSYKEELPWGAFTITARNQAIAEQKGWVDIVMPATVTTLIPITKSTDCVWDIESYQMGGYTYRWMEGVATISPEATR